MKIIQMASVKCQLCDLPGALNAEGVCGHCVIKKRPQDLIKFGHKEAATYFENLGRTDKRTNDAQKVLMILVGIGAFGAVLTYFGVL
jgi:hypothetical protein